MKIICSLNGIDGSGKTTQKDLFENNYKDIIDTFGGLEKYEGFPKLDGERLHKWWFETSTIESFCDSMYKALSSRNKAIIDSEKGIIIIDKGILNFESRIIATLLTRGFNIDEIKENIKKSKMKNNFVDIENVKIFLNRKNICKEKINNIKFSKEEKDKYSIYQNKQFQILESNTYDYKLLFEDGETKTFEDIKKIIIKEIVNNLRLNHVSVDIRENLVYMGNTIKYIDCNFLNKNDEFLNLINILKNLENEKNIAIQAYNCKKYYIKGSTNEEYKDLILKKANNISKISENLKLINIDDYKIPLMYKNILRSFISEIVENISKIRLILVHGSAGRECMHENWSDLDVIIALDKYNFSDINKISKVVNKYKEEVKIGTTVYSKLEIESLNVDAKSLFALYQMQNQTILPIFLEDIEIPTITYEDLINKNFTVLPEAIHKLKRLLYAGQDIDRNSIVKVLNLIMKVILINNNIFFKSYEEIFYNFAKLYNIEPFDIKLYLNDKENDDEKLKEYAKKVIEKIINY